MAENKTVNIMFYNKKYDHKPVGKEIGAIQNRLAKTTMSLEELANNMANGCTLKCAYMGGTKNTDFVSQQLFGLDFDHGLTIEDGLHKCETLGIMPIFGYTTFSHTPENHRFRLIFCNDKVIYDVGERRKIQLSLMKAFGFADPSCKDETRMFFGGRSLIMFNENNVINGNEIIQKYYSDDLETNAKYKPKSKTTNNKSKNKFTPINQDTVNQTEISEKVKAISELNVDEMKRLLKKYDRTKPKQSMEIAKQVTVSDAVQVSKNLNSNSNFDLIMKMAYDMAGKEPDGYERWKRGEYSEGFKRMGNIFSDNSFMNRATKPFEDAINSFNETLAKVRVTTVEKQQPVNVTIGDIHIDKPVGDVEQFAKALKMNIHPAFDRQIHTNLKY